MSASTRTRSAWASERGRRARGAIPTAGHAAVYRRRRPTATALYPIVQHHLVAKTVGSIRAVGNLGFAILGDPTRTAAQHDPLLYGLSLARVLTQRAEVMGEIEGRWLPSGGHAPAAENAATLRGGARYTFRSMRLDTAVIVGLADVNASFGLTAGITWVFDAFRAP